MLYILLLLPKKNPEAFEGRLPILYNIHTMVSYGIMGSIINYALYIEGNDNSDDNNCE